MNNLYVGGTVLKKGTGLTGKVKKITHNSEYPERITQNDIITVHWENGETYRDFRWDLYGFEDMIREAVSLGFTIEPQTWRLDTDTGIDNGAEQQAYKCIFPPDYKRPAACIGVGDVKALHCAMDEYIRRDQIYAENIAASARNIRAVELMAAKLSESGLYQEKK